MSAQSYTLTISDHTSPKEPANAASRPGKPEEETPIEKEEETYVEIVKHEEVTMRNVVHPARGPHHHHGNGDVNSGGDVSDGVDMFGKEAFAPLLTSNQYQVRKLAAQALMDVALMMANISQLRTLVALGPDSALNFHLLVALVAFSLVCQLVFAVFMFVILMRETTQQQKRDFLDNLKILEENGLSSHTTSKVRQSVTNEMKDFQHQRVTSYLNYLTMILVFFITVTNMFITGFGIKNKE